MMSAAAVLWSGDEVIIDQAAPPDATTMASDARDVPMIFESIVQVLGVSGDRFSRLARLMKTR